MIADSPGFTVIGIEARTTNAREMTGEGVIPKMWERFMKEDLGSTIPNRTNRDLIALYTDYESDEHGEYTFLVGAMVSPGTTAPAGMASKEVPEGRYWVVTSERGPVWRVVVDVWRRVWQEPIDRAFLTDFEVYNERAVNPSDAIVDVWVGVK